MATKWPYNRSPGLFLSAFCTICRALPVGAGLGAKFGRKMTEKYQNLDYDVCFLACLLLRYRWFSRSGGCSCLRKDISCQMSLREALVAAASIDNSPGHFDETVGFPQVYV